jgi:hypothetical protein
MKVSRGCLLFDCVFIASPPRVFRRFVGEASDMIECKLRYRRVASSRKVGR